MVLAVVIYIVKVRLIVESCIKLNARSSGGQVVDRW